MEHPTSTASQPTLDHLQPTITTSTPFIVRTQLVYASPQSTTPSQTTSSLHRITNTNIISPPHQHHHHQHLQQQDLFNSRSVYQHTGAGHSNMLSAKRYHCFILPLHHTFGVGITGLSFLRYPTSFTSKGALLFPSLAFPFSLLFLFLSILLFWLSVFFCWRNIYWKGEIYQRMGTKVFSHLFWGSSRKHFFVFTK